MIKIIEETNPEKSKYHIVPNGSKWSIETFDTLLKAIDFVNGYFDNGIGVDTKEYKKGKMLRECELEEQQHVI